VEPVPLGKVTHELELLKLRLRDTAADQIEPAETQAMAQEISAIRLQLKRLRFDQDAMSRAVHEANASISGGQHA
jgi:DNA-directed RNA polymerase alpha subunit